MSTSKIYTEKYIVYKDTGQVYKGDKFFRTLTDLQNIIVKEGYWSSLKRKRELDELIDTDFESYKTDTGKEFSINDLKVSICEHKWHLLEKTDKYLFYCTKCLTIQGIDL